MECARSHDVYRGPGFYSIKSSGNKPQPRSFWFFVSCRGIWYRTWKLKELGPNVQWLQIQSQIILKPSLHGKLLINVRERENKKMAQTFLFTGICVLPLDDMLLWDMVMHYLELQVNACTNDIKSFMFVINLTIKACH